MFLICCFFFITITFAGIEIPVCLLFEVAFFESFYFNMNDADVQELILSNNYIAAASFRKCSIFALIWSLTHLKTPRISSWLPVAYAGSSKGQ